MRGCVRSAAANASEMDASMLSRRRITPLLSLPALLLALAGLAAAEPGTTAGQGPLVNCYDPERGIVQDKRPHECDGEVVSDARARELREQRQRARFQALRPGSGLPQPRREQGQRLGSAFAINAAGDVLTARHVVDGCRKIALQTAAGDTVPARILAFAKEADVALLTTSAKLPPIPMAPGQTTLTAGDPVVVVGYPNEGLPRIRPRSVVGEVVDTIRIEYGGPAVAFRGAVRPGNSGGPLLRADGTLAGLVVAKVNTAAVYQKTGRYLRDVAFALPVALLRDLLAKHGRTLPPAVEQGLDLAELRSRTLRVICTTGNAGAR